MHFSDTLTGPVFQPNAHIIRWTMLLVLPAVLFASVRYCCGQEACAQPARNILKARAQVHVHCL